MKLERALMMFRERYGGVDVVEGVFLDSPFFYLYNTMKKFSPFQELHVFNSVFLSNQAIPNSTSLFKDALPLLSSLYVSGRFFPIPRKIRIGSLQDSCKLSTK